MGSIQLIALDIDGVISRKKGAFFSPRIISLLGGMNILAAKTGECPPVTLITGRPAVYVESLMQVIHGFIPAVFEHGTGIYDPVRYLFIKHPDLNSLDELDEIRKIIKKELVDKGLAVLQGGKDYSLSLFSRDRETNRKLSEMVIEKAGGISSLFEFTYSSDSLNIIPRGFNKGKGIDFLSDETGIKLENILGVGDSDVDVPFLLKTGFSAAPANAGDMVKKAALYCPEKSHDEGLEEILHHFALVPDSLC